MFQILGFIQFLVMDVFEDLVQEFIDLGLDSFVFDFFLYMVLVIIFYYFLEIGVVLNFVWLGVYVILGFFFKKRDIKL